MCWALLSFGLCSCLDVSVRTEVLEGGSGGMAGASSSAMQVGAFPLCSKTPVLVKDGAFAVPELEN